MSLMGLVAFILKQSLGALIFYALVASFFHAKLGGMRHDLTAHLHEQDPFSKCVVADYHAAQTSTGTLENARLFRMYQQLLYCKNVLNFNRNGR